MHHMYSSPSSSREETAQETTRVKPVVCVFTKSSPHHLSSPPTLRKTEHVPSPFPTRNLVRKPLQQAACAWYMLPTASPPPTPIDSSSAPKATTLQHQRRLPTHPLTQPPEHKTPPQTSPTEHAEPLPRSRPTPNGKESRSRTNYCKALFPFPSPSHLPPSGTCVRNTLPPRRVCSSRHKRSSSRKESENSLWHHKLEPPRPLAWTAA